MNAQWKHVTLIEQSHNTNPCAHDTFNGLHSHNFTAEFSVLPVTKCPTQIYKDLQLQVAYHNNWSCQTIYPYLLTAFSKRLIGTTKPNSFKQV